jgi:hypothetical protein
LSFTAEEFAWMLWVVKQRNLWGDYGDVLISGYAHREEDEGPLLLHRTGPFLPPISFPWFSQGGGGWGLVVSETFRGDLEASGFAGLAFGPAVKARIIRLPWHEWDLAAGDPQKYPPGGEPGDYICNRRHDAGAASPMPEAWEFLPPLVRLPLVQLEDPRGGYLDRYRAQPGDGPYPGLFLSRHEFGKLVVNEAGRGWFESRVGEWVQFCEVETSDA